MALQDETGAFQEASTEEEEGNYFKTWHWFYRFQMAGRTIAGYQREMWTMVRMRIRGFREAPWGPGMHAVGADPGRPATVGDVYTSEKATAIILRWHVFQPANVIAQTHVARRLTGAFARATAAAPTLAWNTDPSTWTDAHETALIDGLIAEADAVGGDLQNTTHTVADFPVWAPPHRNDRRFRLDPTIGGLDTRRRSFAFDDANVPALPVAPIAPPRRR
jgi:hypothetical protein